jgi:hypothetical protein
VIDAAFEKRLNVQGAEKAAAQVAPAAPEAAQAAPVAPKIPEAKIQQTRDLIAEYTSKPRNEIPQSVSDMLVEQVKGMINDIENGTPGQRFQTPEGDWIAQSTTYPDWYGEIARRAGGKDAVLKALEKIIVDRGMDKGKTVEYLKGIGLEQVFGGEFADPVMLWRAGFKDEAVQALENTMAREADISELAQEQGFDELFTEWEKLRAETPAQAAPSPQAAEAVAEAVPKAAQTAAEAAPVMSYAPGAVPSNAQWADAQTQGMNELFARIEKGVSDNWGKTYTVDWNPGMEKAIAAWGKQASKQVSQARLVADKVGDAARDFTLLSYPEKRYFDLAVAYAYPFHFWYGRTYAHWLERLAYNADIVAAYSKYRKALEQIHAGAPDWWKYSINTDELLGIETDHPLFFNLETTLNPINGLSGVDFDDPQRRPNWWTAFLDDMNKFGPTLWTPISIATALALKSKGEDEAAARWGSRLIPQTAALKSAMSILNVNIPTPGGGVNEFDPSVHFFSGGVDPYERRRIGRKLYDMEADGYTEAEIIDAANFQQGPVWQAAAEKAVRERAGSQLAGTFLGWSAKSRSASDMQIDQFYQDYYRFWAASGTRSPEEVRTGLEQMRQKYPFMDTIILSRKTGFARDRSYAYNVLSRIPPGQKDDLFKMAGLNPDYMDKFYSAKGDISKWKKTDRDKFMAGIVDLGARLDMPDTATREEWNEVKNRYTAIDDGIEEIWGEDMQDRISLFFKFENKEDGYAYLDENPDVQEAMNWKDAQIINDPLMKAYYSSIDKIERYYNNMMYSQMEEKFGADIWDVEQGYYDAKLTNTQKQYLKQHPELKQMWDAKDIYKQLINGAIIRAADNTVEVRMPRLRPTVPESMGEIGVDMGLGAQAQERTVYDYTWDDFAPLMSDPMQRLVIDAATSGEDLSYAAQGQMDYIAEQLGIDGEMLLMLMINSLEQ